MSRLEKRLIVFALVFVAVYVGAIILTVRSRMQAPQGIPRLESAAPGPAEGHLMLAELLLPMLIILTISVCFIIVRKRRERAEQAGEDTMIPAENPMAKDSRPDHEIDRYSEK